MRKEFILDGKKGVMEVETDADKSVFEEIFKDLDYKAVDKYLNGVVLDIGAHIGCFSVYASIKNPSAKIFAYEPDARNFSLLKENLKANRIQNVVCKNMAVAGSDGVRELNVSDDSHNHSFVKKGKSVVSVNAVAFGRILGKFEQVDFVKMDCEGAEYEIFDSCSYEDLKKIKAFYIEYHEFESFMKSDLLVQKLKLAGFKVEKRGSFYANDLGFILATRV